MLLTKHISEISFRDVIDFCRLQIPEGTLVEYKSNIPPELEKHIAAMANTLGGVIILGVEEDNERPKEPFTGKPFDESIRRAIENKVHSSISPIPFVEVTNCPDSAGVNSFIVIRVPQSISTPHSINKGQSVYIRTGQSSHPEEIASPEQMAWLYERRAKSAQLKTTLKKRSLERFENLLKIKGFNSRTATQALMGISRAPTETPILSIVANPSFPAIPLFDYRKADGILNNMIRTHSLPMSDKPAFVAVAGGAIQSFARVDHEHASSHPGPDYRSRGVFSFLEIDEHGLCVFRNQAAPVDRTQLPYLPLVHLLIMMLVSLRWFYRQIGYWGFIDFELSISESSGLWLDLSRCESAGLEVGEILDDNILIDARFSCYELDSNFDEIACGMLAKFAHAAGLRGATDAFHKSCFKGVGSYMALFASV